jgi:hypothetical protein
MQKAWLALVLSLSCYANVLCAASFEKAQSYAQNNLLDEAKKELIDVIYSDDLAPEKKASALYLLGNINAQQGHPDAAAKAFGDLAQRYPNSPEAQMAKGSQTHPADARKPTPDTAPVGAAPNIRLVSRGNEPRYPLRYSLDAKEEMHFVVRGTMLDSDCPTEPSKERYPSADMAIMLSANPLPDSTKELIHASLGMTMSGSAPGKNGAIEHMEPFHFDMPVRISATGQVLDDLPAEMKKLGGMQSFGGQFPEESVGVGARWEVRARTELEEFPADVKFTYSVTSITATAAQIRITAEFGGSYVEGEDGARIEGRGDGETHWRAGHIVANDTSLTAFIRMIETKNGEDAPGHTACVLFAMGTDAPAAGSTISASTPVPVPAEPSDNEEALTLVDTQSLGRYWRPLDETQAPPDIGGIESSYCIAIGFTIGRDGKAANPYPLYMHADGVSAGLQEKAKQSFERYVETLRFVPAHGEERTPVFTYGIFGRYHYRSESSDSRKRGAENRERGWCEDAARRSMDALRANAR